MLAAKADAAHRSAWCGQRENSAHAAVLVADLDAHAGCRREIAVHVDAKILRAAVVRNVRHVQPEVRLFVAERAVGL
jgi:hypothetical protein